MPFVDQRELVVDASEFARPVEDAAEAHARSVEVESDEGGEDEQDEEEDEEVVGEESDDREAPVRITGSYGSVTVGDDTGEEVEDDWENAEVASADEPDEAALVGAADGLPPIAAPRHGARPARAVVSFLAVAAVATVAAYFFGLRDATPDEPTDRVLGTQGSAEPARRDFSEATVDIPEPVLLPAPAMAEEVPVETETVPPDEPPAPAASSEPAPVPASANRDATLPPPAQEVEDPGVGFGWLLVKTTPPGATVVVDGVDRGQTPLSLDNIAFGTHRVSVSHAGYGSEMREVSLSRDNGVASVGIDLVAQRTSSATAPASGSLQVDSRPDGARVMLDGRLVGTTPVVVPDVRTGTHRLRVERDGYQAWVTAVEVPSSDRVRVAASLERMPRR